MNEQNPLPPDHPVNQIAQACGGKVEHVGGPLPDGSGFAGMSIPLSKDHWLYKDGENVPPMGLRCGTAEQVHILHGRGEGVRIFSREGLRARVVAAARYAIRGATMNGKEMDFDPDALVQNMVVGLLGYCTEDGLSGEACENPPDRQKL